MTIEVEGGVDLAPNFSQVCLKQVENIQANVCADLVSLVFVLNNHEILIKLLLQIGSSNAIYYQLGSFSVLLHDCNWSWQRIVI